MSEFFSDFYGIFLNFDFFFINVAGLLKFCFIYQKDNLLLEFIFMGVGYLVVKVLRI